MGKKIGAWCGVAACVVVAVVVLIGCTEPFDIMVINTTKDTISVKLDFDEPLIVEPNSYSVEVRGIRNLKSSGYNFEIFGDDGRLLGTISVPGSEITKNLVAKNLYVLTVAETDLMTVEESIAFETAREEEFVSIAMVDFEDEDQVKRLFEEYGLEMQGFKSLSRFTVRVMRKDRVKAMELLEQDAKGNGYEIY